MLDVWLYLNDCPQQKVCKISERHEFQCFLKRSFLDNPKQNMKPRHEVIFTKVPMFASLSLQVFAN